MGVHYWFLPFPLPLFSFCLSVQDRTFLQYFTVTQTTVQTYFLKKNQFVDLDQRQENSQKFLSFSAVCTLKSSLFRTVLLNICATLCTASKQILSLKSVFTYLYYFIIVFFTKSQESLERHPVLSNVRHLSLKYLGFILCKFRFQCAFSIFGLYVLISAFLMAFLMNLQHKYSLK